MYLRIELLSDTAFGRGDGIASHVNSEIEHDKITGLPIIKGRTLKGLFVEACADILYGLKTCNSSAYDNFENSAKSLFGKPGSGLDSTGKLHFGTATLPQGLVETVQSNPTEYVPSQVLESFTTIRHQTAVDEETDIPKDTSLRAIRVVLRGTIFHTPLTPATLEPAETALLWACANTVRNAGQNRTRGLGHIHVELYTDNRKLVTGERFNQLVRGVAS